MTVRQKTVKVYGEPEQGFCVFDAIFKIDSDIMTVVDIKNDGYIVIGSTVTGPGIVSEAEAARKNEAKSQL